MEADIILPSLLFTVIALSLLLSRRVEYGVKSIFRERRLGAREAAFIVITMGVVVTLISLMPAHAVQILFIAALSYVLLIFSYLLLRRPLLTAIPPIIFILTYILAWNIFVMNVFAALFAVIIIALLNALFSWKAVVIFAALLAAMDFIQVFITGHMIEAAGKLASLRLPILLTLQAFPSTGFHVMLGLGDIFLSGLLSAQTASKYGLKAGLLSAVTISIAFSIFEILIFNLELNARGFPATLIVLSGWLLGLGLYLLKRKRRGLGIKLFFPQRKPSTSRCPL